MNYQPFSRESITAIARAIGDTQHGLTGSEIGDLLAELDLYDPGPITKWRRIDEAFSDWQKRYGTSDRVITFLTRAMHLARYTDNQELFEKRRSLLNPPLSIEGMRINENGRVARAKQAESLTEIQKLTNSVKAELKRRKTHEQVLIYCEEEVLRHGYFHAILEASKSVFDRLREATSTDLDGAALVDNALSVKHGVLAINSLATSTERNEQTGLCNLVKSISGMYRNPVAHDPRLKRDVAEEELLEALTLISYVHRRLDDAHTRSA